MTLSNENKLELLPHLPDSLVKAYGDGELVVFIGAGVSRLMGCEGWNDMADGLIKSVFDPASAEQM